MIESERSEVKVIGVICSETINIYQPFVINSYLEIQILCR